MKHYRRKKFFYKLFLRKSPRNAALFGVSFITMLFSTASAIIYFLVSYALSSKANIPISICVAGIIFILWLYAIIVLANAYSSMMRKCTHKSKAKYYGPSNVSALFFRFGGAIVSYVLFKQKRYSFGIAGVVSLFCAVLLAVSELEFIPIKFDSYTIWMISWLQFITLLLAVSGYRDKYKLNYMYLWPLLLLILYVMGLRTFNAELEHDIHQKRAEISRLLGHSIDLKDFWKKQANGLMIENEPLKSFVSVNYKNSFCLDTDLPLAERRKQFTQWNKEHPEYIKVLNNFLKLQVTPIGHPYTDETLASVEIPELNAFRNAARFLSYDLSVNCKSRDIVLKRNNEIDKLRDWCIQDNFLISKLVALAIERIRLLAMSCPLQAGTLNPEDLQQVMRNRPNWGAALADGIGNEATMFESMIEGMLTGKALGKEFTPDKTGVVLKHLPLEFAIHFNRDYLFALGAYNEQIKTLLDPISQTGLENTTTESLNNQICRNNIFIISSMMIPSAEMIKTKRAEMNDFYRLMETAIKVMEYRKKHGKLPESLGFLPTIPKDSIYKKPFIYEHGKIKVMLNRKPVKCSGFRIYIRDETCKAQEGFRAKNKYTVILEP